MKKRHIKRIEVRYGYIEINLLTASKKMTRFSRASEMVVDRLQDGGDRADTEEGQKLLAAKFEEIFGAGACQKTFGTDTPGILQFAEFWDKFSPLWEKWSRESSYF